jgi:hypothetical protein
MNDLKILITEDGSENTNVIENLVCKELSKILSS